MGNFFSIFENVITCTILDRSSFFLFQNFFVLFSNRLNGNIERKKKRNLKPNSKQKREDGFLYEIKILENDPKMTVHFFPFNVIMMNKLFQTYI